MFNSKHFKSREYTSAEAYEHICLLREYIHDNIDDLSHPDVMMNKEKKIIGDGRFLLFEDAEFTMESAEDEKMFRMLKKIWQMKTTRTWS